MNPERALTAEEFRALTTLRKEAKANRIEDFDAEVEYPTSEVKENDNE